LFSTSDIGIAKNFSIEEIIKNNPRPYMLTIQQKESMYDQLSNQEKLWEIQIIKLVDISTFKRVRGWMRA
jgi:hypothetical protein